MALGQPIQIRLNPSKQLFYESEAAHQHIPLATYLRERLENTDALFEEISALRRTISQITQNASSTSSQSISQTGLSIQTETLLLLRSLVNPQKLNIVHSELRRLGLNVWQAENEEVNA